MNEDELKKKTNQLWLELVIAVNNYTRSVVDFAVCDMAKQLEAERRCENER